MKQSTAEASTPAWYISAVKEDVRQLKNSTVHLAAQDKEIQMSKDLIIRFNSEAVRECFITAMCDDGGENGIYEAMETRDVYPIFSYTDAFGIAKDATPVINVKVDTDE